MIRCGVYLEEDNETAEEGETRKEGILPHSGNSTSCEVSLPSSPPDDRYESCGSSDVEFEDIEAEETDANDDGSDQKELPGNHNVIEQESSESLFSLSIDSRKHVCAPEAEEKEVTSCTPINSSESARVRSRYVHSVLNPVENLSQCEKPVKTRATSTLKNQDKENLDIGQDFVFHMSLSSWLNEPETTLKSNTSSKSAGNLSSRRFNKPRSVEDRSVLGVLTTEDLRQLPSSNSTRQSSGKSPDDTPMIGTVRSYWNRTGRQWIQVRGHPAEVWKV